VRPPRELKHHEGAARIFNHLEAIRLDMQSSKPKASGSTRPKDAPRELSGAVRVRLPTAAGAAPLKPLRSPPTQRRFAHAESSGGGSQSRRTGLVVAGKYKLGRKLGSGSFGDIYHGLCCLFANSYIVSQPKRQYVTSMHLTTHASGAGVHISTNEEVAVKLVRPPTDTQQPAEGRGHFCTR
jgi:hypothetical protein